MKKISIEIKSADDISNINRLIENIKYESLNIDVGIGDSKMVDGRSILGLMNTFRQNMSMVIYGDNELEDQFLVELSDIVRVTLAVNTKK